MFLSNIAGQTSSTAPCSSSSTTCCSARTSSRRRRTGAAALLHLCPVWLLEGGFHVQLNVSAKTEAVLQGLQSAVSRPPSSVVSPSPDPTSLRAFPLNCVSRQPDVHHSSSRRHFTLTRDSVTMPSGSTRCSHVLSALLAHGLCPWRALAVLLLRCLCLVISPNAVPDSRTPEAPASPPARCVMLYKRATSTSVMLMQACRLRSAWWLAAMQCKGAQRSHKFREKPRTFSPCSPLRRTNSAQQDGSRSSASSQRSSPARSAVAAAAATGQPFSPALPVGAFSESFRCAVDGDSLALYAVQSM